MGGVGGVAPYNNSNIRETIAHELGHELEGEADYKEIKKAALAATKQTDIDEWRELYKGYDDVDAEIAAKALGRRLATPRFVERFANRSIIRRAIDFGKMLLDALRADNAGRLEIAETEKLIDMMNRALQGVSQNAKTGESGTKKKKYLIVESGNEKFVAIEPDSITNLNQFAGESLAAKVRNYLKQYRGTVLPLGSTDKAYMRREAEGEYTNPAKELSDTEYTSKLNAASEITNLLSSATFVRHEKDNGRHKDATRGWNYYELKYVIPTSEGLRAYQGEVQIKLIERGDVFYDITKIKDITNGAAGQALIKAAGSVYDVSNTSIPQNPEKSTPSEKKSYNLTPEAAEQAVREAAEVEQFRNEQDREAARVRQADFYSVFCAILIDFPPTNMINL